MNAKEYAAAISDRHMQLQNELADARAETATQNEQLASAREVIALQRTPQPQSQLLVLADSSKLNAFSSDIIKKFLFIFWIYTLNFNYYTKNISF